MGTIEERLSRLEGAYQHLATKSDIADLDVKMANHKADLINWMVWYARGRHRRHGNHYQSHGLEAK